MTNLTTVTPTSFTYTSSTYLGTSSALSSTKATNIQVSTDGTQAISVGADLGQGTNPVLMQWSLSGAHDFNTRNLVSTVSIGHPNGDGNVQEVWVNSTGTVMYIGYYDSSSIERFTLSTAWDISNISRTSTYSVGSAGLHGLAVNEDETILY